MSRACRLVDAGRTRRCAGVGSSAARRRAAMSIETPVRKRAPRRRGGRGRTVVVCAVAVVAVPLGGAAWAAVPEGETNVIHACYSREGALRVIDTSSGDRRLNQCTSKETALSWNQEGPQGESGLPGA